jgi:type IV fimbrial biogenesis protein FimT
MDAEAPLVLLTPADYRSPADTTSMRKVAGFTFVELMITIAVAAVLMGFAVPAVRQFLQSNRMTSQLNMLSSALATARNSAITQNARVLVCPSSDGSTCTGTTGWQNGWIAFIDRNNDFTHSPSASGCNQDATTDCLLIRQQTLSGSNTLSAASGVGNMLGYNGTGTGICDANKDKTPESCVAANTYFTICDTRGSGSARGLAISNTGRTTIIDKTPTGSALTCP